MTLTTRIRINHPLEPLALLDAATVAAGGDPATVERIIVREPQRTYNAANQGLHALLWVEGGDEHPLWTEPDEPAEPEAMVCLAMDTPYGAGTEAQVRIGSAVAAWLDDAGVPRERWWWQNEYTGEWHPGTVPVLA